MAKKTKALTVINKAPKLHEVHPNHLILGIVIGVVIALIAAFGFQHLMNLLFKKDEPGKTQYLYVQQAQSGTFNPIEGQKDMYVFSMTGISPRTTFVINKPRRVVGSVSSEKFLLATWNTSTKEEYESNPPDAALTVYNADTGSQSMIALELMNPSYSFATGTLSYTVKQLSGRGAEQMSVRESVNASNFPQEFVSPVLYIDIIGTEPTGNDYLYELSNLR